MLMTAVKALMADLPAWDMHFCLFIPVMLISKAAVKEQVTSPGYMMNYLEFS